MDDESIDAEHRGAPHLARCSDGCGAQKIAVNSHAGHSNKDLDGDGRLESLRRAAQ